MPAQGVPNIVFTLTARCRDCYRCVRGCPAKAIRMENGQAYVDGKRCIACGTCIRECPQQAKTYRHDTDVAERLIAENPFVAASIAPSFAAVFSAWQRARLASALRALGFRYVGHTSQGAYQVSHHALKLVQKDNSKAYIATACPAVVNYLEKYHQDLIGNLLPLVSPMTAHGRMLKKRFGDDAKVIFIGPCVAKKSEITRPDVAGSVDCVLTFQELMAWMEKKGVHLSNCEESNFDEKPVYSAQLYPLPGGLIKTAGIQDDGLTARVLRIDGIAELKEFITAIPGGTSYTLVEPLFCNQGCINGPGISTDENVFERRKEIIEYNHDLANRYEPPDLEEETIFQAHYESQATGARVVTEEEIQQILERTGKSDPQQQLNCSACGYESCRDKAVAVALGMAEPEMCIPYMRRLAERRTDQIFSTTPNGVIILDWDLNILGVNPTFKKFFSCSDAILGRHVSYLMDPAPFEKLISGAEERLDITVNHKPYGLLCREIFYVIKPENQIVGVFMNITSEEEQKKRLDEIRAQTIEQANELLEHQIKMAQKIAMFLGESTARGEELVKKLMSLSEGDERKSK